MDCGCVCVLSHFCHVRLVATPQAMAHQAPVFGIFLSKITGAGCYALLQGIFLTQESNLYLPSLLHWQETAPPEKPMSQLLLLLLLSHFSRVRLCVTP